MFPFGAGSALKYEVARSLRFRANGSTYLSRTPSVAGNRRTWTWSGWIKRGVIDSGQYGLFGTNGANGERFVFDQAYGRDYLVFYCVYPSPNYYYSVNVSHSDPASFYHVVLVWDTLNSVAADRVRIYVNGIRQTITARGSGGLPTLGLSSFTNAASQPMYIGAANGPTMYFDGYLAEINFIDGQALDPTYFGGIDLETNAWVPKKYTGEYGTCGFFLNFSNGSSVTALGYDASGNNNHFTPTAISLTQDETYDWMIDSPTNTRSDIRPAGNYAVPVTTDLGSTSNIATAGGLEISTYGDDADGARVCSINFAGIPGKWYFETKLVYATGTDEAVVLWLAPEGTARTTARPASAVWYWSGRGASSSTFPTAVAYAQGDTLMIAYDSNTGEIWGGKNGVWMNNGDPANGIRAVQTVSPLTDYYLGQGTSTSSAYTFRMAYNFGQRPFTYDPPFGFRTICTSNLPNSTIKRGDRYFNTVLETGANIKGASEAIFTGDELVWIKDRANANNHQLVDTVRGTSAVLQTNTTTAETTYSVPAGNSVGWVWRKGDTSGFDIVTYTGTGVARTVTHSLGVAPKMIITKKRNGTSDWGVYHSSIGNTNYLLLNTTGISTAGATFWNNTSPTSSEFTVGSSDSVNTNGSTYVAYLFAEITGFSKISSYVGTGVASGPVINCGFKPKWIMIKRANVAANWCIWDTSRDTSNVSSLELSTNLTSKENSNAVVDVDIFSTGFKLRNTTATFNASGGIYVYAAFAETPFKYSRAR